LRVSSGGHSTGNFNAADGASMTFQNGIFTLDDGTTLTGNGFTRLAGGALVVTGAVSAADFALDGGILKLNLTGVLNIGGDYSQSSSGTLSIDIGGLVPGVDFGQLNVAGAATLGGTLSISLAGG